LETVFDTAIFFQEIPLVRIRCYGELLKGIVNRIAWKIRNPSVGKLPE
jgi:hypothetical protein